VYNAGQEFVGHRGLMRNLFGFLCRIGKSLMLPIAFLPIAAIFMRFGQSDLLNVSFIAQVGVIIFDNLPIIFAICIAINFADNHHWSAALAAFSGIIVFLATLKCFTPLNLGIFSGIIIGTAAGLLYNRFKDINLPPYLSFFSKTAFVPIITCLISIVLALICAIFLPTILRLTIHIGNWIIHSGNVGLFTYGFFNKALMPFGLDQILTPIVLSNDNVNGGIFMAGLFPVTLFGLTGYALAIAYNADSKARANVCGIMFLAGFVSFLTGITAPLEYTFMFLCLPLYIVHAVLSGLGIVIVNIAHVKLGFSFSAGFIDYIFGFNLAANPIRIIPIGIGYFFLYFFIFTFAIRHWDIRVLGRLDGESDSVEVGQKEKAVPKTQPPQVQEPIQYNSEDRLYIASQYVAAMGGYDNIITLDNCATSMHFEVADNALVDKIRLKKLGARGVLNGTKGKTKVIIGAEVEGITDRVKEILIEIGDGIRR
jgi:PTS system N-acetylglucosamine-specific IIC component